MSIVGVAIRAGDDKRITITDDDVICPDPFHLTGEGGTSPAGGDWAISHCAKVDCDGTRKLHQLLEEIGE